MNITYIEYKWTYQSKYISDKGYGIMEINDKEKGFDKELFLNDLKDIKHFILNDISLYSKNVRENISKYIYELDIVIARQIIDRCSHHYDIEYTKEHSVRGFNENITKKCVDDVLKEYKSRRFWLRKKIADLHILPIFIGVILNNIGSLLNNIGSLYTFLKNVY